MILWKWVKLNYKWFKLISWYLSSSLLETLSIKKCKCWMVWDVFHFNLSKPYGDKNIKSCNPFMGTKLYAMREVEPYGGHVFRQLSCQLVNGIYPLTPNMERWINFTLTLNFYLFNFNLASKFKSEYLNWFFPSERKKK